MELHTDDFPLSLNRKFYDYLIENFKAIEQEESQLRDDLNAETNARISADSDERNARINGDINERNSRINADNRLQSQIDAIIQRLDTNEKNIADLQTRMSTAEEQIKKLNEIIFGTEYINDTENVALDDSMTPGMDTEVSDTKVIDDNEAEIDTARDDYVTAGEEIN